MMQMSHDDITSSQMHDGGTTRENVAYARWQDVVMYITGG